MHIVTPYATLFYEVYGTGTRPLLLFHGAGQDHTLFAPLAQVLSKEDYTCYAFDLFFHGQSTWTGKTPLSPETWRHFITTFCQRHQLDTFDVLGYSIGSRFALATLMTSPQQVRRLTLCAPDAVTVSPWYTLATGTAVTRQIFKLVTQYPGFLFGLAHALSTVLPKQQKRFRFALRQMDTAAKRERIYRSWTVFRQLSFAMRSVAAMLHQHNIALTVIVGKNDVVIPPHTVNTLLQWVPNHTLHTIPTGHNGLIAEITENPSQYIG